MDWYEIKPVWTNFQVATYTLIEGGVISCRFLNDDVHLGALPAHKMQLVCTLNTPVSLKKTRPSPIYITSFINLKDDIIFSHCDYRKWLWNHFNRYLTLFLWEFKKIVDQIIIIFLIAIIVSSGQLQWLTD